VGGAGADATNNLRGGYGLYLTSGSLANHGAIVGGIGGLGAGSSNDGSGGSGLGVQGGDVTNYGTVSGAAGRAGGSNNDTGAGGNAGDGLRANNFVDLVNDGLIIGGNGGDGASITDHAGYGGIGVFLYGGALANLGTVAGGSGGIGR